jgi:hypothetical protein
MGSEDLYHHYSNIEHERRLPKHLQNQTKANYETEINRKGTTKEIQRVGADDKGQQSKEARGK